MARPIKRGLDCFPFDVDFFSDATTLAIEKEFGNKGTITIIKLLCAVYRNGYFIEWSSIVEYKLLREMPDISPELLRQIVNRLVKRGFFDAALFDSEKILTSRHIQQQYAIVCSRSRRKPAISQYKLLDDPIDNEEPIATPAVAATTTQPPPVSESVPLSHSVGLMKADTLWLGSVSQRYNQSADALIKQIDAFALDCQCQGQTSHNGLTHAKRHFCQWLNKRLTNPRIASPPPKKTEAQLLKEAEARKAAEAQANPSQPPVNFSEWAKKRGLDPSTSAATILGLKD